MPEGVTCSAHSPAIFANVFSTPMQKTAYCAGQALVSAAENDSWVGDGPFVDGFPFGNRMLDCFQKNMVTGAFALPLNAKSALGCKLAPTVGMFRTSDASTPASWSPSS